MKVIAKIYTDFTEKFSIPRQSGLAKTVGKIVFEKEFAIDDALRGIDQYEYLWLIWEFSQNKNKKWSPTVRPPRLGGNKRVGVFATRSPFRPNPLGISSVKLLEVRKEEAGTVLFVEGADMLDGTPIYDIKPYLPYTDSHPDARYGFAREGLDHKLKVVFDEYTEQMCHEDMKNELISIIEQDPRPAYIEEPERIYGMAYGGYDVRFTVQDNVATIISINKQK